MLHYLERIGKDEFRWVFIVSRTADKYDVRNVAKKGEAYGPLIFMSVMWAAMAFGGWAFAAFVGRPAFAAGQVGNGWTATTMGYLILIGCLAGVWAFVYKIVEERIARKHGVRDSVRAVYSDSVPFKALVDRLGPEAWQTVRSNCLRGTLLGQAILFQLDIFFDNTYVTFVTPDGVLNDESMSARGYATLDANVKPTVTKIKALIKQHEQCAEGRNKEIAAAEEAEQIRATEQKRLNLNIAAKA